MWALITGLPGMIAGLFGSINHITDAIANEKIAGLNAKTDQDRIASQERVTTLEARRDLMIAEGKTSHLNIWMRTGIAIGPASVLLKIFLWDKVIGSFFGCSEAPAGTCKIFTTDALDDNLWRVVTIVVGFYFLTEISLGVTRIIKKK